MIEAVSRETSQLLDDFAKLVASENEHQNLVARSTIAAFEQRHIADSLQLIDLAPPNSNWCDIGSGAGIPGIIVAIVARVSVTLVEPRRLRADFLRRACEALSLHRVRVEAVKAERVVGQFDVITARAVADIDTLFAITHHLAHPGTRWILPKGRSAKKELDAARQSWQGDFSLIPSRTSDEAMILVADQVRRKGER